MTGGGSPPWIQGLSVLGGEPCEEENERALLPLLQKIWWEMPEQDIWLFSGYTYGMLRGEEILRYVDVLVDGPFLQEQKDISLAFRGSRNQRILRLRNGEAVGTHSLSRGGGASGRTPSR